MHESLHPKALSTLPFIQRAIANSAMNGSVERLQAIVAQIAEMGPEGHPFLPVLYHHLDTTKIPSADAMDREILSNGLLDTIMRASLSLEGVFNIVKPPQASALDLWQRVWPWIQFFDIYPPRFPGAPTENILRARSFGIIAALTTATARPHSPICAVSGIGFFAAQFWANYFQVPDPISELALRRLGAFLLISTRGGSDFEEYIDGAGGVHTLAKLVVQLVDYLLSWDQVEAIAEMGGVVSFAWDITTKYAWPPPSGIEVWGSALLSHKYARALMSALWACNQLSWLLRNDYSYSTIAEVVDAGFLQFVVSLPEMPSDILANIRGIIKSLIQPATIYYPVLSAIEAALPLVAESTSKPTFISSKLYVDWREFINLVHDRLKLKKGFDSGQYPSRKACDNLECGRILIKTAFKRCAGCRYAHYCSRDCQIKDWSTGHRMACQNIRVGSRNNLMCGPAYLTSHDRAFIRVVLLDDYERYKQLVFLTWIVRMRQHGENLLAIFDYTKGQVGINAHPLSTTANTPEPGSYTSRSLESGRRMHLTILLLPNVMVPDGFKWILPMRSSDADVHDALFRLSQTVPPGTDTVSALSPELRSVVTELVEEACPHIVEIV
ncbi:hypothetical protein C8R45DRAFT_1046526 [Mycena sanguinolenta]|nr:hypothetical protein C8R45DRAFT_1046526 [Mycena sanguinolenta]